MWRNLKGQRNTCGSFQPIRSSARDCNDGRRGGPACLSQTFYRGHASNGCAYHSISRRGWDWVAASRNFGWAPGTRTRLARNHLLDQNPYLRGTQTMTTFATPQPVTIMVDDARRGRPATRARPGRSNIPRQCPKVMDTPILAVNCH